MKDNTEILFIKSVGLKIQELRKAKQFSQAALSYDADIPKSQIGRIERGEINTTIVTLFKICKALDIDIRDLFG